MFLECSVCKSLLLFSCPFNSFLTLLILSSECLQKCIALNLAVGESVAKLAAHWIVADPSRLAQILINFLTNAIKVSPSSVICLIMILISTPFSTLPILNYVRLQFKLKLSMDHPLENKMPHVSQKQSLWIYQRIKFG